MGRKLFSRKARAKREDACIIPFGDARDRGRRAEHGSRGELAEPVPRKKKQSARHEPGGKMRKLNRRKKDAVGENLQSVGH